MPFTNYSDLQAAVAQYMQRTNLTAQIVDFIQLAETRMKYGTQGVQFASQPIDVQALYAPATLTTVAAQNYVDLPTGFLGFKGSVYVDVDPKATLEQTSLEDLNFRYPSSTQGLPVVYAIAGDRIYLGPSPDDAYNLPVIYKTFSDLSVSNTTSTILTRYPNVYLYGSVLEGFIYTRNVQAETMFAAYKGAVDAANSQDRQAQRRGSRLQQRSGYTAILGRTCNY